MKRLAVILLLCVLALSSCEKMRSTWHRHDRLAKVGSEILYESDLRELLPAGTSSEDSTEIVNQYVRSWALAKLMQMKAKEELPKSERDFTKQIEEFTNNLLEFKYEKYYLESRLDTTVTEEERRLYYEDHVNSFVFPYSVVKGRVIVMLTKSPYYDMIKTCFACTERQDVATLEELCHTSAEKYTDFNRQWVNVSVMAGEVAGMGADDLEALIASRNSVIHEINGTSYFIFVEDRTVPNEVSPYEYNRDRITETIISKRKQELLLQLERDLLNDAKITNKMKLYDKK